MQQRTQRSVNRGYKPGLKMNFAFDEAMLLFQFFCRLSPALAGRWQPAEVMHGKDALVPSIQNSEKLRFELQGAQMLSCTSRLTRALRLPPYPVDLAQQVSLLPFICKVSPTSPTLARK